MSNNSNDKNHINMGLENNIAHVIYDSCKTLDKTAYFFKDTTMSYRELFEKSACLTQAFQRLGIEQNDRIIVCLNDSPAIPITLLAAMAMGAIPVVINPTLSEEGYAHIFTDSNAKLTVCEQGNLISVYKVNHDITLASDRNIVVQDIYPVSDEAPQPRQENLFLFDEKLSTCVQGKQDFTPVPLAADHAALWQYTSGTTGQPKAVKHVAKTFVYGNEFFAIDTYGLNEEDVIYSCAKMFFGYGLGASFFTPLLCNAAAVLEPALPANDGLIAKNILKYQPTFFYAVPSIYQALLENAAKLKAIISKTMTCISAGAHLPAELIYRWRDAFGHYIYNGIGASEVGYTFVCNSPSSIKPGTTGKPVAGYTTRLIESNTPDAYILCVKGPYLTLGYHNHPEQTQEKFDNGWYITGDVFTVDEDGYYTYQGREDDLFKINGLWVSPLNIEQNLANAVKAVKECALVPTLDTNGLGITHLQLVIEDTAVQGWEEDTSAVIEEVKTWLHNHCAHHEIPSNIDIIDTMPRNANGKVLRNKLKNDCL